MNIAGSALIGLSNIQDFTYYFGSLSILDVHILHTYPLLLDFDGNYSIAIYFGHEFPLFTYLHT